MAEDELSRVERIIQELGATIAAPTDILPTRADKDFGYPHVEISNGQYQYVAVERGKEQTRNSTGNLDQLLFWVFEYITFSMASKFEVSNRYPREDPRPNLFRERSRLLNLLNPDWSKKFDNQVLEILKKYPYRDNISSDE